MTALEFTLENFAIDEVLTRKGLAKLLSEFALLKCAEQREICAKTADDQYEDIGSIDSVWILNSPNPEM